uniref:Uncharacterized protein n=2 Tax=Bythopirellula goksoeyrii TaxID=1400387 RepID=A0A5B9QBM8_9BACT|nr:hypothetical protein Pr1d_16010 [Bythopirellula goksoeyrii]
MKMNAMIEDMEAKVFEMELRETSPKNFEQSACYESRENYGRGFFGRTESAALKKAIEAVEAGEVGW